MKFGEVIAKYPVAFWAEIRRKGEIVPDLSEFQVVGERKPNAALI